MNEKDIINLRGHLKKCIRETDVYVAKEYRCILPGFNVSLLKEIIDLIKQKSKNILARLYELS